jgi:membrane fusion protein (multidrug efflux system)
LTETTNANTEIGAPPASDAPGPRGMLRNGRRRATVVILALIVIAGAIFGGRWLVYTRTHVSTDDAQVEADIYPVSPRIMGHVSRVVVATNQAVGAGQLLVEIDPRDYQVALAQAEAALAAAQGSATAAAGTVNVTEQTGAADISQAAAQVAASRAGELMSTRQSESAAGQVEAARADEAAAAAAVDAAQRGVAAAEAAVTGAQARADEAQKNAARAEQLLLAGAVSAQQRDAAVAASVSAQAAVEVTQAQAESARAVLRQAQQHHRQAQVAVGQAIQRAEAARAQVTQAGAAIAQAKAALRSAQSTPIQTGVRRSEARGAQGRVAQARAQLQQARLNLSYTRIVAPVDGVVAKKNVETGQFVQPGQSLMAIVATGSTHITANFKETQMRGIRPGQRVTFTVDAYPGVRFTGRVSSISPGTGAVFSLLPPENASGNFTKVVQRVPVRIAVDRSNRGKPVLRDGMSAVVTIRTR